MIIVTDRASAQIDDIYVKHGKHSRLSISAGGCQGFNKVWELDSIIHDDDTVYRFSRGSLLIDNTSLDLISGATIDFKKDAMGAYFTVDVPAATSTCGCGTSFSI